MTETRDFALADILTVTTGRLLSHRHIAGVYDLMGFMVGEDLMTHQLPRAMDACKPELERQMPWLVGLEPPARIDQADLFAWITATEAKHGESHPVMAGAPEWQHKDALAELDQMAGTRPVVSVRVEDR
jgi:hypothetical protein